MPTGTISKAREIIRAKELIEKVQDQILDADEFKMSAAEVGAIKLLLNKVIPDLKGVEVSGNPDQPIEHSIGVKFVSPK